MVDIASSLPPSPSPSQSPSPPPSGTLDAAALAALPRADFLKVVARVRAEWIQIQKACIARGGLDPDTFFEKSMPQSELFMAEIIPLIHRLFFNSPQNATIEVLDIGPQTFSGTRLLSSTHGPNTFNNLKMKISALDIHDRFLELKECLCPEVEFLLSDVYEVKDRAWDLVICSHVVEHVPNPSGFVRRLQQLSTGKVVLACPWNENPIVTRGHQNTIDKTFVRSVGGENLNIYTNMMWGKTREVCMFTVDGRAKRGVRPMV